ncbi:unnamed protein product [Callosobruchus maculatus]|uniref:General transcription factor 3C polypeptide 3 n=1 Tax=Callosobruchus maculatus TaxID=64391 RepID=A0A653BHG9_CALMS|nr:unnamed protein product [Callosobruchus maculatus]
MDSNEADGIPIHIEVADVPSTSGFQDIEEGLQAESYEDYESETTDKERPSAPVRGPASSKLDATLKGLMGEANLRYARGDIETAKRMCFEVIRQCPEASEPYLTLAQMYENVNIKKYKGYLLLACHLEPSNAVLVSRIAELCVQENNILGAIRWYSRGIKHQPKDIELHLKRLELLKQKEADMEYKKMVLVAKTTLANNLPPSDHEMIVSLVMEVAKERFHQKDYIRAIEVLKIPLRKIPNKITKDVINMILELLLICERYLECLDIFTQYCGFEFDISIMEDNKIVMNAFKIPENLEIDLKTHFIIFLVKLTTENMYSPLIDKMLIEDDVELFGDLYLDIADALLAKSDYTEALKLLIPLVKSKRYSQAAVWLKYGECLTGCKLDDMAIEAYYTVMTMAPSHIEVLYPLGKLLIEQGKKEEAMMVLNKDLTGNVLDVAILLEKIKLMEQLEDWDGYWKAVELLLSRHSIVLKHYEELRTVLAQGKTFQEKLTSIRSIRAFRGEPPFALPSFTCTREPSVEEEFEIFRRILQKAKDLKQYGTLQKYAFMGLSSKRFIRYYHQLLILALYSCIYNNDRYHAITIVKYLLLKNSNNNLLWNLLNHIVATTQDFRHIRLIERRLSHERLNYHLMLANNQIPFGNSLVAINIYTKEFKKNNNSPFYALLLGIACLQHYFYTGVDKAKRKLLAELISYLFHHYGKLRTRQADQEVFFNLGRLYQQLGVSYLAEYYYKKVFEVSNEMLDKYPDALDLKRHAAYNLHLLYRHSGNMIAARKVLYEYIVV